MFLSKGRFSLFERNSFTTLGLLYAPADRGHRLRAFKAVDFSQINHVVLHRT